MRKPQIFVGSSKEGLEIAQTIQLELQADAVCTIWYQGVFGLSKGGLEALTADLKKFDFAILVLTPDDTVTKRGEQVQLPRDNVMFELGLFMGHLGRNSVYATCSDNTDLPSDLAGVTVAKFALPVNGKSLSDYSTTDLQPYIGPAVHRIRSAIKIVQEERPVERTLHYIPPTRIPSRYLAELQIRLETEISRFDDIRWKFHPPKGADPLEIYLELDRVMETVEESDLVVLHSRGLQDPSLVDRVHKSLTNLRNGQIAFIGQLPPPSITNDKRVSFIGPDDRKVGILAAFALHEKLRESTDADYFLLSGAGGPVRSQGFEDGIKFFEPEKDARVFPLDDVARDENRKKVKQIIRAIPGNGPAGVFACNDETALGVLREVEEEQRDNIFVVGCDATRDMVRAIDRNNPYAVATIEIPRKGHAQSLLRVFDTEVNKYQEARLYPPSVSFEKLKSDKEFVDLWERDPWGGKPNENRDSHT